MNPSRPTNPSPSRPHTTSLRGSAALLSPHGSRYAMPKVPSSLSSRVLVWAAERGPLRKIMNSHTDDAAACFCPHTQYPRMCSLSTSSVSTCLSQVAV